MEGKKLALRKKIKTFEQVCRDSGIKLTHQRMEIFREIAASTAHPSAEEIHKRLKSKLPMISLDTVYRTLAAFEKFCVIRRVHVLDDRGRFDTNLTPHHHLVCMKCKAIQDFYWPTFDEIQLPFETKKWGQVNSKQVELRGICDNCREKSYRNK